ncbi:hypothetical protein KJ966_11915 [bacterium]|nr:hypothetical protein [bacterium]
MSDKSGKIPKKKKMKTKAVKQSSPIREIEYYLSQNGNDTRIIRNIALSSLIPKAESDKVNTANFEGNLLGIPFIFNLEDEFTGHKGFNPFWSFTMMIKESGDHKLLFSSADEAEELYTEILKEW